MLVKLIEWMNETWGKIPGSGLMHYISFRAVVAMIISLVISMLIGRKIINKLRHMQIGETVRDLGLHGQNQKAGTPTMGGIIIILANLIPTFLMARLDNIYILLMIVSTLWMGVIGFIDDYIKVYKKNKEGLKSKFKMLGQLGLGLIIGLTMLYNNQVVVRMETKEAVALGIEDLQVSEAKTIQRNGKTLTLANYKTGLTNVPFFKGNNLDYASLVPHGKGKIGRWAWLIFLPLVIIVVMAVSNGANLTDGLDGLATGVSGIVAFTLGILAYVSGNAIAADYLNILYLPGTGELVIFAAAFVGACLGFMWYNSYPASVFMGDTGSLTMGGIIAALAIVVRKEWLIPILCGIFLAENLSVILQVSYFKYTKKKFGAGKRIFLMSPLHHHYQRKGMPETKIVMRFWIVSILLAAITIMTLKVR